jgi:hypothetical protein
LEKRPKGKKNKIMYGPTSEYVDGGENIFGMSERDSLVKNRTFLFMLRRVK